MQIIDGTKLNLVQAIQSLLPIEFNLVKHLDKTQNKVWFETQNYMFRTVLIKFFKYVLESFTLKSEMYVGKILSRNNTIFFLFMFTFFCKALSLFKLIYFYYCTKGRGQIDFFKKYENSHSFLLKVFSIKNWNSFVFLLLQ